MIGKFLAWFDRALGHDEGAAPPNFYFAIRPAGMIDIAGAVGLAAAVDHFLVANRKEIFAVIGAHLAFRERAPGIFDHAAPFFYGAKGKEP